MDRLATIQVNLRGESRDIGVFVVDVADWMQDESGGCTIRFRDGRQPIKVTETTTQVQTAINALWDQYVTRGGSTAAYTPTNVTTDRAYDADTVVVAELADVVGMLITDLQALGLVG